jgi:hypothetical protein
MKIVELGTGHWTVYAVCSDETTCALLDFVAELDEKRSRKVLADLQQFVPNSEPRDWVRMDFSWKLRGTESILEFRWPQKGGGTPRVYWFYDEGRLIVCSHGVNKKGDTDPEDIRLAERAREDYLRAKAANQLKVVSYQSFMTCATDEEQDTKEGE